MAFGFEFRDAAGNETLTIDEAMPRVIDERRLAWGFSGTIWVPGFDDQYGMFYVSPELRIATPSAGQEWWQAQTVRPSVPATPFPTLNWNNATKAMSIAPATLPDGWPVQPPRYYWLVFLGLNARFEV